MSQEFQISYWWKKRNKPGSFMEIVDASKLSICLDYFLSIYQGQFTVSVQGHEACFDLDPDLSTIFETIPNVLTKLTKDTNHALEIDFFEQGTDVGMLMERQDNVIQIRFETAPGSGMRFKFLPDTYIPVQANQFLEQWLQFIRAVLKALLELQPELLSDESYQQYCTQLELVESQI
ncbi:MAG: hypothetical protein RID53_25175 [Coleofasciculus sp. B1-GNL1-01]|uniref:hypothetical protein n=1 Tax=Coleofasciculus sp. B1-GNL1-01 TaxID=3068484 RepID=UPI0032F6ECCA